jgi:hypothetical protein
MSDGSVIKIKEGVQQVKCQYEALKIKALEFPIAHIVSTIQHTVDREEFLCEKLNMWKNFNDLFEFELNKINSSSSSSSEDETKYKEKAMLNMLFKLDSIHDFFGERTSDEKKTKDDFKKEVLDVLNWKIHDDEKKETTKKKTNVVPQRQSTRYQKQKKEEKKEEEEVIGDKFNVKDIIKSESFENDLFMWLLFDGLKKIYGEEVRNNTCYNKKIMLTPSIQDYVGKVSTDKNKSAFTIDAGLTDFNIFKKFLKNLSSDIPTFDTPYEEKIIEDIEEVYKIPDYIEEDKKEEEESKRKPKRKPKDETEEEKYDKIVKEAKICMKQILLNELYEKQKVKTYPPNLKTIFEKAVNNRWILKGCNDKTYIARFIGNIIEQNIDVDEVLKFLLTIDKYKNTIFKDFIDACKNKYNKILNIINKNEQFLKCKGDIKEKEINPQTIVEKIFENLDKKNQSESEEFRIIAPQKFDSNRTTGGSWDPTSLEQILRITDCYNKKKEDTNRQFLEQIKDDISLCSFQVLDDECYFYSTEDNKFIFRINNDSYPIKAIVVQGDIIGDKGFDGQPRKNISDNEYNKYDITTKTLFCKNAPGVTELYNIYNNFKTDKNLFTIIKGQKRKREEDEDIADIADEDIEDEDKDDEDKDED